MEVRGNKIGQELIIVEAGNGYVGVHCAILLVPMFEIFINKSLK